MLHGSVLNVRKAHTPPMEQAVKFVVVVGQMPDTRVAMKRVLRVGISILQNRRVTASAPRTRTTKKEQRRVLHVKQAIPQTVKPVKPNVKKLRCFDSSTSRDTRGGQR